MPSEKGKANPQHTEAQKIELGKKACDLYASQQATIASCCKAVGISDRSFNLWVVEYPELADYYKKSKERQDLDYWESLIKPLAKTALQKHLEAEILEEHKEVVSEGRLTGEVQKTTKTALPNPTITIFALKGLYPGMFSDKVEHSGPDGAPIEIRRVVINAPNDEGEE